MKVEFIHTAVPEYTYSKMSVCNQIPSTTCTDVMQKLGNNNGNRYNVIRIRGLYHAYISFPFQRGKNREFSI